ncbi:MAG: nitroreductase family deazaflavin-dependent oxidoreductase [Streptosporangiaceae bacterium]
MPSRPASPRITAWTARLLRARWLVRAPIWLYRARLGFVFGTRLLMIEHTGRKTGILRYVVLEAVDHPDPSTWIVAAGFGERAQWLRNVRTNPQVRVWTGAGRPATATARPLTREQPGAALAAYAHRHPRAWAALRSVFETTLGTPIDSGGTSLPMVVFDLTGTGNETAAQPGHTA